MELKLGYDTPGAVRELFAEYTHMLVAHDPYFQAYLDLQHYDAEVADLTQKYGLPDGRLYIAWCSGQPAGRTGGATSRGARGSRPVALRCAGWTTRRASSSGCMCVRRFAARASPGR